MKTVLEILTDRECTILFSTHITSDLERVADRVAILDEGKMKFLGGLDQLKEQVKRLKVRCAGNAPLEFAIPGVFRTRAEGNEAIVYVEKFSPSVKSAIEKEYNAQVDVEDLNLEDIFVEMTR